MISITSAVAEDITPLLAMVNKAYRGEEAKKGWTHEADLLEGDMRIDAKELEEIIESDKQNLLLAKQNGRIVGCVNLRNDDGDLYLGLLSVDPDEQGSGIGKHLLAAADNYARENGFKRIYMTVISVRKELISWYVRHGYSVTETTIPFTPDPKFGKPTQPLHFAELEKIIS